MPRSRSVSANVVVIDSVEVYRTALYSRYNSDPKTLLWGTPALTGESSNYSATTFTRMYLLCK
jgi:hypothetical protein